MDSLILTLENSMHSFHKLKTTTLTLAFVGATSLFLNLGCDSSTSSTPAKTAMATMANTGAVVGINARGTVNFTKVDGGVRVVASFQGLPPGVHGFHVHANASCDSLGVAAGGHFNPMNMQHGLPDSSMHHMGDLGNLTAGADSMVTLDHVYPYLTLDSVNTVVNHALIVHALPDMGTQPTGAAGARISCGIVMTGM